MHEGWSCSHAAPFSIVLRVLSVRVMKVIDNEYVYKCNKWYMKIYLESDSKTAYFVYSSILTILINLT